MQSTSWEMLGWKTHKLESRLLGETSITSDKQTARPLWQKVKEESEKAGLKLNIQKTKIMASGPITSWQIDEETVESMVCFILGGLQNHCRWWLQPWNKKTLLGRKVMTNLDSILRSRDITLPTKVDLARLWFFLWSCMDVRVGLWRKLNAEE